jgi:hypothetical protein
MIVALSSFILWIPAVLGWGSLAVLIRRKLHEPDPPRFELFDPICGFSVLAVLGTLLNFFTPLTWQISLFLLAGGCLLFWLRLKKPVKLKISPSVCLAAAWLALIAVQMLRSTSNPDTGLYQFQTVKWMNSYPVPFGLANLHGRLGFNSAWLAAAALLQSPFGPLRSAGLFIPTGVIVALFGFFVYQVGVEFFMKKVISAAAIFMLLASLFFWSPYLLPNINTLSTDIPTSFLVLSCAYYGLSELEGRCGKAYGIFVCFYIAFFSVTVKFSALPLLTLPAFLLLAAFIYSLQKSKKQPGLLPEENRPFPEWRSLVQLTAISGAVLVIPWLVRNILLSGCLVYPVTFTCIPTLPWAVPQANVASEAAWIQSWARLPGATPDVVLANSQWLKTWIEWKFIYLLPAILSITLGSFLLLILKKPNREDASPGFLWILGSLFICLTFWFCTAPDLRFGEGYLWSISLIYISLVIQRILMQSNLPVRSKSRWQAGLNILVVSIFMLACYVLISSSYNDLSSQLPPLKDHLLTLALLQPANVEARTTGNGVIVYVPTQSDECLDAPLPCTPSLLENLTVIKNQARYTFYLSP